MSTWFEGGGTGSKVDVAKLMDSQCGAGIWELVDAGALVSLGLTSDGGALGVTVTVDGRWRREYVRTEDELLPWLAQAIPAVVTVRAESPQPRVNGSGSRRSGTR